MNIGVAYDNGQIAANLGSCRQVLIVTTEGREPVSKHMAEVPGASTTDLIKLASMEQIDVLICGSLGLAIRNALEMIGVLLVPGCEGAAEEAVAKFAVSDDCICGGVRAPRPTEPVRTNGNGKSRRDGEIRRAFVCFYNNWMRCLCKTAISFAFLFCYTGSRIENAKEGFL